MNVTSTGRRRSWRDEFEALMRDPEHLVAEAERNLTAERCDACRNGGDVARCVGASPLVCWYVPVWHAAAERMLARAERILRGESVEPWSEPALPR